MITTKAASFLVHSSTMDIIPTIWVCACTPTPFFWPHEGLSDSMSLRSRGLIQISLAVLVAGRRFHGCCSWEQVCNCSKVGSKRWIFSKGWTMSWEQAVQKQSEVTALLWTFQICTSKAFFALRSLGFFCCFNYAIIVKVETLPQLCQYKSAYANITCSVKWTNLYYHKCTYTGITASAARLSLVELCQQKVTHSQLI